MHVESDRMTQSVFGQPLHALVTNQAITIGHIQIVERHPVEQAGVIAIDRVELVRFPDPYVCKRVWDLKKTAIHFSTGAYLRVLTLLRSLKVRFGPKESLLSNANVTKLLIPSMADKSNVLNSFPLTFK